MKNNKFIATIFLLSFITVGFISCDEDFANIETDILNNDIATNFNILKESYPLITYTEVLEPVQTNGLPVVNLGKYEDSYGSTSSSFVSQITTTQFGSDFGEEISVDSVVLTMPYFSVATDFDDNGNFVYRLDSVIGNNPMKLRVFENNYFLRDFNPEGDFEDIQEYYSNKSASNTEQIPLSSLQHQELALLNEDTDEYVTGGLDIDINNQGYILTEPDNDDEDLDPQVLFRLPPGIRVHLEPSFWTNAIINMEDSQELSNQNSFLDYFRGLYFTAEPTNSNGDGSFLILNPAAQTSNITIYYTRLTPSTSDDEDTTEQSTIVFTFGPNRASFTENNFTNPIVNGNSTEGDSRIYLKGGEGSIGKIKLFNGDNIENEDDTTFDEWKESFVETDENGEFVRSKRFINEANLVFHVDQDLINGNEPNRIFIYDANNNIPLADYFLEITNTALPNLSKTSHLGPLQRIDDEPNGDGIKYKIRITEHIKNLLLRDSTNVELGLSISLNVNLENTLQQRKTLSDITIPSSTVNTPRGTVLHGNNSEDEDKRVYLEIYYTEPEN